jgi:hypothetical protein
MFSTVFFANISIFARRYAVQLGVTERAAIVHAIGRAIGAVAAHEFGHQNGINFENTTDSNAYDYVTGDRPEFYFGGDLHWSPRALQRLKEYLPTL